MMERRLAQLPAPDPLLERLVPLVGAWCARLCPPGLDSDGVAQEAILTLLRRRAELIPGQPVEPWAFAVTRMTVRAHRQRAWFRRWWPGELTPMADHRTPARHHDDAEAARLVHGVLSALSDDFREVLVLCDAEERTRAEVARILGIPEGTVKSRVRLAREAFRVEAARRGVPFVQLLEEDADV